MSIVLFCQKGISKVTARPPRVGGLPQDEQHSGAPEGYIANAQQIHERQDRTIEQREECRHMLSPDLRAIFLQRHIAPPMQSIFDRPMGPHQLSYLASICLPGRETGDAVAHVLAGMSFAAHPALHPKHLLNTAPLLSKPLAQVGARRDHAFLMPPMSFVHAGGAAPARAVGARVFKEELEIGTHRGLIVLGYEHILALVARDRLTKQALGVYGIGADDPPFDQHRREHLLAGTDFIFLAPNFALSQHIARAHLIEGTQMHRRLMGCLMPMRSAQRFAIKGHMPARQPSLLRLQT
jgi:hypothetical protein